MQESERLSYFKVTRMGKRGTQAQQRGQGQDDADIHAFCPGKRCDPEVGTELTAVEGRQKFIQFGFQKKR